ncbi:Alpha-xylosidase BoGH31A [termite gut metagenome]|uniref:Alpha-xylosidase BoGH31A n=1 Tax=termite gut metagenome TaxID=433724 RepID=A0A5J4R4Y5_9ZZZZ
MKTKAIILIAVGFLTMFTCAFFATSCSGKKEVVVEFKDGTLTLIPLNPNAVRVRFAQAGSQPQEELIFIQKVNTPAYKIKETDDELTLSLEKISVIVDKKKETLRFTDQNGHLILQEKESGRQINNSTVQGEPTFAIEQQFLSPSDEYLYGTGQFQDGYLNIKGLTRRLTQVNTQISIPFILSSKGYGLLWHNYGLTDFNPADQKVELTSITGEGTTVTVNVTSTNGTKQEVRVSNGFSASFEIPESGRYALLLDVGQNMSRKHYLNIDGKNIIDVNNGWLPPTSSVIIDLEAGKHEALVQGNNNDKPVLFYKLVTDETTFRSPVAEAVDYTVFAGFGDDVISSYRQLSGAAPMMPRWALGYIHCRERFKTQEELLSIARKFRERKLPMDLIVQDWLYWGKYGWNAMQFDETTFPDATQMVKDLHDINVRLMISVWSRVDTASAVGKQLTANGAYIPERDWVDFHNPEAAAIYWKSFNEGLVQPHQVDAWWQDATEPENDDLHNRWVNKGTIPGDKLRNTYPLFVNKTVYEGYRQDNPGKRTMILTRSAFSGMQRYGTATWSGDVSNDWETLRRQIAGGLGQMAAGLPWWTYDAGGFFRFGFNQYTDKAYHERFLRWFQAGTFIPLLRVHGYQSDTEFWNYGEEVERIALKYLNFRYRMLPYTYSQMAAITFNGSTLMRPLVMDFPFDTKALEQKHEFMFGPSFLVAPVLDEGKSQWAVYLPENPAGWIDFWSGNHFDGSQTVNVGVDWETIPLFVKAGSILPLGPEQQYTSEKPDAPWEIRIYPGADAKYTIYEDEGNNYNYETGAYSVYDLIWDDAAQTLTIGDKKGKFEGMNRTRELNIVKVAPKTGNGIGIVAPQKVVSYAGKQLKVVL